MTNDEVKVILKEWLGQEIARGNEYVREAVRIASNVKHSDKKTWDQIWSHFVKMYNKAHDVKPDIDPYDFDNPDYAEKFEQFHHKNPWVYEVLRERAINEKLNGRKKAGIEQYVNDIRWNPVYQTQRGTSDFKISNCLKSYYSRFLMKNNSELHGFFNISNKNRQSRL